MAFPRSSAHGFSKGVSLKNMQRMEGVMVPQQVWPCYSTLIKTTSIQWCLANEKYVIADFVCDGSPIYFRWLWVEDGSCSMWCTHLVYSGQGNLGYKQSMVTENASLSND